MQQLQVWVVVESVYGSAPPRVVAYATQEKAIRDVEEAWGEFGEGEWVSPADGTDRVETGPVYRVVLGNGDGAVDVYQATVTS